eukprot:sb/3469708/
MDEVETEFRLNKIKNESDYTKRFICTGLELENVVLKEGSENKVHVLTLTTIGRIRCLVAAEVDGCDENGDLVEIKSNLLLPDDEYQKQKFYRFKLFAAFFQCYLVGIQHLLVGFRSYDNFLKDLKRAFLDSPSNCRRKVYHLEYKGGDEISLIEVPDPNHIPQYFKDHAERYSYGSSVFVPDIEISELGILANTPWRSRRYHDAKGAERKNHRGNKNYCIMYS